MEPDETAQEETDRAPAPARPGALPAFLHPAPRFRAHELAGPLVIGRKPGAGVQVDDVMVSREHTEIARHGDELVVRDLGSRNGTHVDGEELHAPFAGHPRVIRCGGTLLL